MADYNSATIGYAQSAGTGFAGGGPIQLGVPKDASVQDRIAGALASLAQAHGVLDGIENGPNAPDQTGGQPQLGLIGGSLACEEQAARLLQRLMQLRGRLGSL